MIMFTCNFFYNHKRNNLHVDINTLHVGGRNMIAPMRKGPYGFLFKTEKTCHKDMTLRKEK